MSADPHKGAACPIDNKATGFAEGDISHGGIEKKHRTVRFPNENQLVTEYFEPANPWHDVPTTSRAQLAQEYLLSCRNHNTPPIDSVLHQIRELPESSIGGGTRAARLALADCSLEGAAPVDALEALLRKVQFHRVELDHAEVDDEGAEALFDMIEYYESACVVSITGPRQFGIRGWQAASRMIKKSAELSELEVLEGALESSHAPVLARALKPHTCRLRALCLQRTTLSGEALMCLVIALKSNASLRELRLPDNNLTPHDAQQLGSLLRFNTNLQLLDLSNNLIQDIGVGHIADALVEQSARTPPSTASSPMSPQLYPLSSADARGLAYLVLWNNQLTRNCAQHLSKALRSSHSLCVLNIGRNALGTEAVRALSAEVGVSHGNALLSLGLQCARLGPDAGAPLADLLRAKNTKLQRLDLRDNRLGAAGLQAIVNAMKDNHTLTQLDLDDPAESSTLSAEDSEAAVVARLTRDVRALCRRNEPPATEPERRVHRKISLTCHTACVVKRAGVCAARRGSRLRSPAPSPAPSPAGSPLPHHQNVQVNRFSVTRVTPERESSTESSSPTTPTRPSYGTPSRFKVMQVTEAPSIQVYPAHKRASRFSVTRNYDSIYNPSPRESPSPSPTPNSPSPSVSPCPSDASYCDSPRVESVELTRVPAVSGAPEGSSRAAPVEIRVPGVLQSCSEYGGNSNVKSTDSVSNKSICSSGYTDSEKTPSIELSSFDYGASVTTLHETPYRLSDIGISNTASTSSIDARTHRYEYPSITTLSGVLFSRSIPEMSNTTLCPRAESISTENIKSSDVSSERFGPISLSSTRSEPIFGPALFVDSLVAPTAVPNSRFSISPSPVSFISLDYTKPEDIGHISQIDIGNVSNTETLSEINIDQESSNATDICRDVVSTKRVPVVVTCNVETAASRPESTDVEKSVSIDDMLKELAIQDTEKDVKAKEVIREKQDEFADKKCDIEKSEQKSKEMGLICEIKVDTEIIEVKPTQKTEETDKGKSIDSVQKIDDVPELQKVSKVSDVLKDIKANITDTEGIVKEILYRDIVSKGDVKEIVTSETVSKDNTKEIERRDILSQDNAKGIEKLDILSKDNVKEIDKCHTVTQDDVKKIDKQDIIPFIDIDKHDILSKDNNMKEIEKVATVVTKAVDFASEPQNVIFFISDEPINCSKGVSESSDSSDVNISDSSDVRISDSSDVKISDKIDDIKNVNKTYSDVVKTELHKDKPELCERVDDSIKNETELVKNSDEMSDSDKFDVKVDCIKDNAAKVHTDKDFVNIDDILIRKDDKAMKKIEAITEDLGNLIQEMKDISSKSKKKCTVEIGSLNTNIVPGNINRDVVLKKNKSESSLDSPDLEVSRLMNKKLGSPFRDSNSSLEISGDSMESLNAIENIPKPIVIQKSLEHTELDRRKDDLSNESSVESSSDATPVNNFLNTSVSSNDSVSPIIFQSKKIHGSLSSLEASVSSLDSKQDKIMVTSADSGIEHSLQNPSEYNDASSNEGTLTHNSSLKETVKRNENPQETLTSSPKRASSLLDVPAMKNKGLERMRKISWVAPSPSFHIPKEPEKVKEDKPSHLEKLLSLFQHPTSLFSRSQSDDERKSASNTPPRKDSSLTSSFWSWGSAEYKEEKEDSSEADSTLSERVQVSFVDETFSKKLDSKTPSTDTDNTLSEYQSVASYTTDVLVQKCLDISLTENPGNSDTIDLSKPNDLNKNITTNVEASENDKVKLDENDKPELTRPRSFAAVLKASGSENTLEKQPSPDISQLVEKLPVKVIRGIKENISPENTLTSSMTNTQALAIEMTAKNPLATWEMPLKSEPKTEEHKCDLAPIATIDETCDIAADNFSSDAIQLGFIDDAKVDIEVRTSEDQIVPNALDAQDEDAVTKGLENIDLGKDALSYLMYENQDFEPDTEQTVASKIEPGSLAQELKDAANKEMIDLSPELVIDEAIEVFTAKEIPVSPVIPDRAKLKKSNSLEDLSQRQEKDEKGPKAKTIAFKVPETSPRDIPERSKLRSRTGSSPKSLPESLNKPCPLTKMDSILSKKKKKVSSLGKMARDSLLALNMSEEEIAEFRRSYKLTSVESLRSLESVSEDANSQSGTSFDSRCRACLRTSQESLMSLDSITEDCKCADRDNKRSMR